MTIIFKAHTGEGYCFKILSELLQNNLQTACFRVSQTGIKLCMMDLHQNILIDLALDGSKFLTYKYKNSEDMFLGINLSHFHKMLKPIKRKEHIQLTIDDEHPKDLGIEVFTKDGKISTKSFIKIQNIQNLEIDIPEGYKQSIVVPTGDFQKMCKNFTAISSQTHIKAKNSVVCFSCETKDVMSRQVEYGEKDDDSDDENEEYEGDFETERLTRITKVAGLGSNMQVYTQKNEPILFKCSIGMSNQIGIVSIYLKSKNFEEVKG